MVVAVELVFTETAHLEVPIIDEDVPNSLGGQVADDFLIPDTFGQPESPGNNPESISQIFPHHHDLTPPVARLEGGQDRLEKSPRERLDLTPADHIADEVQHRRVVLFPPQE